MPLLDPSAAAKCYARPKVGDVYRRFTNPQRYQEGTVVSMDVTRVTGDKPTDVIETWVAVLVYGENEMWKFGWQTLQLNDQAHWQPVAATRAQTPAPAAAEPAREPVDQKLCPHDGMGCGREECRGGRCHAKETAAAAAAPAPAPQETAAAAEARRRRPQLNPTV